MGGGGESSVDQLLLAEREIRFRHQSTGQIVFQDFSLPNTTVPRTTQQEKESEKYKRELSMTQKCREMFPACYLHITLTPHG